MTIQYQFIKNIAKLPFVKSIILFGSRARGDNEERSDIDLAVDCYGCSHKDWLKVLDLVEKADTLLNIDCVRFDTLQDTDKLR
ncbi:conserved hypothetical protein [Alphaproteobacteria bacterium]